MRCERGAGDSGASFENCRLWCDGGRSQVPGSWGGQSSKRGRHWGQSSALPDVQEEDRRGWCLEKRQGLKWLVRWCVHGKCWELDGARWQVKSLEGPSVRNPFKLPLILCVQTSLTCEPWGALDKNICCMGRAHVLVVCRFTGYEEPIIVLHSHGFFCLFFNSLDITDLLEGFEAGQWHSYCFAWDFPPGENISALMACTVVDPGLWWEPQPSPIFLPGKSHGQGSLASYSSWDCKETRLSDSYFHFSFIEIEYYTCQATFSCSLKNAAGL